ncbi:uncharacterized protein At5g08430 isoform X3 [Arachis duranensis]|uniref:Uncharacterized protein At5g08430 isoform X3 n=1 Tax=Arachis duranensis TaxID=130453 RepID=A0A9C6WMX1_ARADU|nr:uncharacterized protein At5g08430 isoform X3 [Arachis duranensis]
MGKKSKIKKEEVAEDWCFVCKDGGLMRVCDYGDCLKSYHPSCVKEDDSFLEADTNFTCDSHICSLCQKASKFRCFCCPNAVCGRCLCDAEFVVINGTKGLCHHCIKLAILIEENVDIDSDGGKVDFKDPSTYECLFSEYYENIKRKEGLKSQHVSKAHKVLKSGRNLKSVVGLDEIGEGEDDIGESDGSDFIVSDDDLYNTAGVKHAKKKKRCVKKKKSINGKLKDKQMEFIGWCSRILMDFLQSVGKDTSREFSEQEVASIIMDYCKENKLFDPEKKRKVLCDVQLRSLLGRKSVNRNSIYKLLAKHFSDNSEDMEVDTSITSEDRDTNERLNLSRKRKLISSTQSHKNVDLEEQKSCFAAIVSANLKLVYLKRSLVEELLKQPEKFDCKVIGSFVRVRTNPYEIFQKNPHKLEQVLGINRPKNDEINREILLTLSNELNDVPILKVSDDDFTEEECKDLCERMRNGLLKQPTVLELDQKARSLHEDIIRHWIPREIKLLQNRIALANEKGWRKELFEYMDRKTKLETPSEQSRLLSDIPKVIPETVDVKSSPEASPRKDGIEQNDLLEFAIGETHNSIGLDSNHNGFASHLNRSSREGSPRKDDIEQNDLLEFAVGETHNSIGLDSKHNGFASHLNGRTDITGLPDGRMLNVTLSATQTMKEKQSVSVANSVEAGMKGKQDTSTPTAKHKVQNSIPHVIVLSDDDEEDANITDITARRQVVENPEIPVWHCLTPKGERVGAGPYSMSILKRWSEMPSCTVGQFKVWKAGQSEEEAIFLTDALRRHFPTI